MTNQILSAVHNPNARYFLFELNPWSDGLPTLANRGEAVAAFEQDPEVETCRRIVGNIVSICVIDTQTGMLRVGSGSYCDTRELAVEDYASNS